VVPRPQLGVDDGRWHLRCRSFGLEVLVVVDDMRSSCELQQQQPRPSKTHYKCSHCPHSHTDQVARTGEGCNKVEDGGCYLYCAAAGRTADRLLLLVSQGDILCLKNTINLWIFFSKERRNFAADFIRRYKEKKEQIQLPIYTQRPLLIKIETSKTTKKTTARKKTGKKTETRDTPKTRTLAQPEKRSTASSPYYELEPSPKKTDLYHLCTNLQLVLGSNFFVGKFAYSSLFRYSTKNIL